LADNLIAKQGKGNKRTHEVSSAAGDHQIGCASMQRRSLTQKCHEGRYVLAGRMMLVREKRGGTDEGDAPHPPIHPEWKHRKQEVPESKLLKRLTAGSAGKQQHTWRISDSLQAQEGKIQYIRPSEIRMSRWIRDWRNAY
jgi:hypothetical protein